MVTAWMTGTLKAAEILLDVNNPRIALGENATQDEIRLRLLECEDVLELARDIEKNGGLFFGERIITAFEKGRHVVIEGNRRVAACQMLLDERLIPSNFKLRFPDASPATKAALCRLAADIAPNRASAEPMLTKRHTQRGVKLWSPVAEKRLAARSAAGVPADHASQYPCP